MGNVYSVKVDNDAHLITEQQFRQDVQALLGRKYAGPKAQDIANGLIAGRERIGRGNAPAFLLATDYFDSYPFLGVCTIIQHIVLNHPLAQQNHEQRLQTFNYILIFVHAARFCTGKLAEVEIYQVGRGRIFMCLSLMSQILLEYLANFRDQDLTVPYYELNPISRKAFSNIGSTEVMSQRRKGLVVKNLKPWQRIPQGKFQTAWNLYVEDIDSPTVLKRFIENVLEFSLARAADSVGGLNLQQQNQFANNVQHNSFGRLAAYITWCFDYMVFNEEEKSGVTYVPDVVGEGFEGSLATGNAQLSNIENPDEFMKLKQYNDTGVDTDLLQPLFVPNQFPMVPLPAGDERLVYVKDDVAYRDFTRSNRFFERLKAFEYIQMLKT